MTAAARKSIVPTEEAAARSIYYIVCACVCVCARTYIYSRTFIYSIIVITIRYVSIVRRARARRRSSTLSDGHIDEAAATTCGSPRGNFAALRPEPRYADVSGPRLGVAPSS